MAEALDGGEYHHEKLGFVITGGEPIREDLGYGPLRALQASAVAEASVRLSSLQTPPTATRPAPPADELSLVVRCYADAAAAGYGRSPGTRISSSTRGCAIRTNG